MAKIIWHTQKLSPQIADIWPRVFLPDHLLHVQVFRLRQDSLFQQRFVIELHPKTTRHSTPLIFFRFYHGASPPVW